MTDAEFRAAFYQHKDSVYRFAWRLTGSASAAEDVAQDTFLVLLRDTSRFDAARAPLRSYLVGIARNLALKRYHQESRWDVLDDENFIVEAFDFEGRQAADIVAQAITSLPYLQREALILDVYEGLSLQEIAEAVGTEIGTVKSRLHRARENLRRMLAPLKSRTISYGTAK